MARNKIRQLMARLNSLEGITVFLTSHDAGDIEGKICKRVMVINFGEIILDTSVAELKRHYLKTKVIECPPGPAHRRVPNARGPFPQTSG